MQHRYLLSAVAVLALLLPHSVSAQQNFKTLPRTDRAQATHFHPADFRVNPQLLEWVRDRPAYRATGFHYDTDRFRGGRLGSVPGVVLRTDLETGQVIHASGRPDALPAAYADKQDARRYLAAIGRDLGLTDPTTEIELGNSRTDELGQTHQRLRQVYRGLPVEPADAYLHAGETDRGFNEFLGRFQPTPTGLDLVPGKSAGEVLQLARGSYGDDWNDLSPEQLEYVGEAQATATLVIYYRGGEPILAYRLDLHPNLVTHVTRYVDAHTGLSVHEISHVCGMGGMHAALPPETASVRTLTGERVSLNTFSQDGSYYLFDVTRPMFATDEEGNATGVIHSFDATGQSPLNEDFDPTVGTSRDNRDWSRTAVSVHHNGGLAYEYFRTTFDRNSIDGLGGTIYSFYNVNNEDGTEMDNAFFVGRAMYYGNGDRGFRDLPMALDIAGHEMTHGVIRATANLVYELQPGAINESMADVFGYLVEGESGDFRLAEDIVTSSFPSGAMRNMRNPNNGGNSLRDRGWQPAHMDEFVVLPNDDDNDHGGVHVNSGIPNRAFALFASHDVIGDRIAEEVYYRALTTYLTRNSRFIDLRIAVAKAAQDLYGDEAERIANEAFAAVGIGGGTTSTPDDDEGGDYEEDIEVNTGDRFVLHTDLNRDDLYLTDEAGNALNNGNPLAEVEILSRPSVTDDGSIALFVDGQNRVRAFNFATLELIFLEENPTTIWRNICISKDGLRIALTTTEEDNNIYIGNLARSSAPIATMTLTNPTTAEGISTNNVLYPDIMEWEPGGEFLMYDALSELDDGITFWDINLLRAWDMDADRYGDGNILKLYDQLEPGTSIGNPTFAKNSPYIIAFDRLNGTFSDYRYSVMAANLERGEANVLYNSATLGYPNFSVGDERIVLDGQYLGNSLIGQMALKDNKIEKVDTAYVMIEDASWGINFATGERDLSTSIERPVVEDSRIQVYPTLTSGSVVVEYPESLRDGNIQVFDLNGRELLKIPFRGVRADLDLSHLPAGGYFLAIPVEAGAVIRRVIRQ